MKSIKDEKNLSNKKILLRLDLNVPLDNGKINDTTRIDKIIPTLNFLIQKRRFFFIENILESFIETCSIKRGELKAELKSAKNYQVKKYQKLQSC